MPAATDDGRTARARRRRDATRKALLRAARRTFRVRGVHAARVEDIVREAGVARGTFYLYFDNKEAVLAALVEAFVEAIRGAVERISTAAGAPPPDEQVRDNLRRICRVLEAHEDVAVLVFTGAAGLDGRSRDVVEHFWRQIEAMVRDALAVGQGLGVVRPCDREQVAVMTLGAARAALSRRLRRTAPPGAPSGEAPRFDDAFLEELLGFVLRSILRAPPAP